MLWYQTKRTPDKERCDAESSLHHSALVASGRRGPGQDTQRGHRGDTCSHIGPVPPSGGFRLVSTVIEPQEKLYDGFYSNKELSRGLDLKSTQYDPCDRRMWISRVRLGSNPSLPEPTDLARAGGGEGCPGSHKASWLLFQILFGEGGGTNEAF